MAGLVSSCGCDGDAGCRRRWPQTWWRLVLDPPRRLLWASHTSDSGPLGRYAAVCPLEAPPFTMVHAKLVVRPYKVDSTALALLNN